MQRAMWTAATGMHAQQLNVDTIANNLANVNTTGFKKARAEFQDLYYRTLIAPGAPSSSTTRNPTGVQMGLGVKNGSIKRIFSQGDLKRTDNPLDMAVEGRGYFKVQTPDGTTAYTRDGAFTANDEGSLVNSQGFQLDPPITIPADTTAVTVGRDGTVSVRQAGSESSNELGQIELAGFINPAGLLALGGNLFQTTEASGDPLDGTPGLDGLGQLSQGFLEISNVSIVTELVDLITAQRAYELNSRAIQTSDQMLQQLNNLIR